MYFIERIVVVDTVSITVDDDIVAGPVVVVSNTVMFVLIGPVAAILVGVIAPRLNVIAGVVVAVATVPLIPLAEVTLTVVTVPDVEPGVYPRAVTISADVNVTAPVRVLKESTPALLMVGVVVPVTVIPVPCNTEVTGAVPDDAAVIRPFPSTVIDALVKLPTLLFIVASVATILVPDNVPLTSFDRLIVPFDAAVTRPVLDIVSVARLYVPALPTEDKASVGLPLVPPPLLTVISELPVIVTGVYVPVPVRATNPVVDSPASPVSSAFNVRVSVPLDVIGDPVTVNPVDPTAATLVTVPVVEVGVNPNAVITLLYVIGCAVYVPAPLR